MSDEPALTDEDWAEGEKYPGLGPEYFMAQRVVKDALKPFRAEHFKTIIDEATEQFAASLQEAMEDGLWGSVEMTLRHRLEHTVDEIVRHLLTGERRWVLEKYVFAAGYDALTIRRTVAAHLADELAARRIADLESENEFLRERIISLERRY
jgi:hypothetical protein